MAEEKKVLIIEDEANLLYGLQAKFRTQGFITMTDEGSDKTEVMGKIESFKPDYIILDVILPGSNGFDLLAEIKTGPATKKIPVFVFTDLSDNDSRQKSQRLGADFYLLKTEFNSDEFVAKFKKIIINLEKIK